MSTSDTTTNAAAGQKVIQQAIAEISHIATLPEITLKIIEIVEDQDSTAADLHKVIANDPALCSRVLKVVNSAFYGLPGQIGSINRAIVLLGLNAVKNIAIAASLAKLFRGGQIAPGFNAKDVWAHCIAVASISKLLADQNKMGVADEVFLAGLMHDIGLMVEVQALRPKLTEVFDTMREGGVSMLTAERHVIGADHQEFGQALCEKWKFPRSFALVAGYHHRPMQLEPELRPLPSIVHVADVLAARLNLGYAGTVDARELDPKLLEELKLTSVMIELVSQQAPRAYEQAQQFLN